MKRWFLAVAVVAAVVVCACQHYALWRSVDEQARQIDEIRKREERLERWFQLLPEMIRVELMRSEKRREGVEDGDGEDGQCERSEPD